MSKVAAKKPKLTPATKKKRKPAKKPKRKAAPKLPKELAKTALKTLIASKGGAPTKYDDRFCEQVILYGKCGKSITWMASQFDVCRDTIYAWAEVHTEFSDALQRAQTHAQAFWEDMGQAGIREVNFSGSTWGRSMAARFPTDWQERKSLDGNLVLTIDEVLASLDGDNEPE